MGERDDGCLITTEACFEHGYIHGGEAEELRAAFENLAARLRDRGGDCSCQSVAFDDVAEDIEGILDDVDARDSLAWVQAKDAPRKRKKKLKPPAKKRAVRRG